MNQRPLLGFTLALICTMTWGILPLLMQHVLQHMTAATLVWYRFCAAALGLLIILGISRKLPPRHAFSRQQIKWFIFGVIGLSANFYLFSRSLHHIPPTTLQVLWQLAPFGMMLCGIFIFKETFGHHQKIGTALLIIGLAAFFNDRFNDIGNGGSYALGVLLGASAALIWVAYGLAQKQLLQHFSAQQILLLIYTGCAIVLLPAAQASQIQDINGIWITFCFLFCCLNTLIGYGAYAESLKYWDATKVSVITTLLPIFTMLFSWLAYWLAPTLFVRPQMNSLSYLGAFTVVSGTLISSIGHKLPLFRKAN